MIMLQPNDPKEKNDLPQTITNDPDEALNDAESVEESKDSKIDEDFPGYPHYPSKDDILNPANDMVRVETDVENISLSKKITGKALPQAENIEFVDKNYIDESEMLSSDFTSSTDEGLSEEDLQMLGEKDEDMDDGDDEQLKRHGWSPSTSDDLDFDNENDNSFNSEDEENDFYSLGGDEKSSLDENESDK